MNARISTLPAGLPGGAAVALAITAPAVPPCGRRVLIVEDNHLVQVMMARVLASADYDPVATSGGTESLEAFAAIHDELSCVLLDVSLVGVASNELLCHFREIDGSIPLVAVSGFSLEDVLMRFQGQRIDGYVQKPFRAAELLSAIETASLTVADGASHG